MNKGLQKVYSEIPKRYELINRLITFGFDIYCRNQAAKTAVADGGDSWLDICSGTGELAVKLRQLSTNGTSITAADFSLPMLTLARQKPEAKTINFVVTNATQLPFADHSFDLITISFATRNLNSSREILTKTFAEFKRVLRPGGRFINLETSQPPNRLIRKLMHFYIGLTVKQIGTALTGSKAGYSYLAASIPKFYEADILAEILKDAGFSDVSYHRLLFGAMAVHKSIV